MSETPQTTPSPVSSPPSDRVHVAGSNQRRTDLLPLMYVLGFLVLGGALFYLWRNPTLPEGVAQDTSRLATLQQQVQDLSARLDSRPASQAQPVNLGPLESRIAAMETRPAPAPVNIAPIEGRIAALEVRPVPQPTDLSRIEERLRALEARPVPPAPGTQMSLTDVASRLDALSGRLDALTGRLNGELGALTGRLNGALGALDGRLDDIGSDLNGKVGGLEGRVAAVEQRTSQSSQQVSSVADRAARLARLQAAAVALDAGRRLGELPGAPPALARFADRAPPTEAGLRLSFPAATEAAHKASQPAIEENQPLLSRTWARAQQLVTVRQGERVLLGDPISGVLTRAKERLDAGDLDGTVKALDGLAGPAAEATQEWRAQAQALLDARAALVAQTAAVR